MRDSVPIGSICSLQNGRAFKPEEWSDAGTPIVRIQNLNDESKPFNYCSFEVEPRFHIKTGDLLFSWSGTPGTSFGAFFWNRGKGFLNQHIFRVDVDESKISKHYLRQALNAQLPLIMGQAHGGVGLQHITKGKLESIEIRLPSLSEQQRIAAIFDQGENLRIKRREALAQLGELQQAIFIEMFGDPATNPKGFPERRLGEIIKFEGGAQPPASTFSSEDSADRIRLVQIRDFKSDRFKTYIPRALSKRFFEKDDVMIGRYGPPVFQILRGLSGSYNVALMKAVPRDGITKDFVFHLLKEKRLHGFVVANSERTAGQSGVNLDLLENYPAYLPSLELQEDFSKKMAQLKRLEDAMTKSLNESEDLFVSLQYRAFRGEL